MAGSKFNIDDLVWAKSIMDEIYWPAKISNPIIGMPKVSQKNKKKYLVLFFGMDKYTWVEEEELKPYVQHKDEFFNKCQTKGFQDACRAIEDYIVNPTENAGFDERDDDDFPAEDFRRDIGIFENIIPLSAGVVAIGAGLIQCSKNSDDGGGPTVKAINQISGGLVLIVSKILIYHTYMTVQRHFPRNGGVYILKAVLFMIYGIALAYLVSL